MDLSTLSNPSKANAAPIRLPSSFYHLASALFGRNMPYMLCDVGVHMETDVSSLPCKRKLHVDCKFRYHLLDDTLTGRHIHVLLFLFRSGHLHVCVYPHQCVIICQGKKAVSKSKYRQSISKHRQSIPKYAYKLFNIIPAPSLHHPCPLSSSVFPSSISPSPSPHSGISKVSNQGETGGRCEVD